MSIAAMNGHHHSPSNGDIPPDMSAIEDPEPELHLEFFDEVHQANTLKSLNMMRKNRHFCDVILHVCA